ncbi:hypothetical protein [Streptomyces sp. NPDC023588]|uniref:hypothetical protein n=1 Tax=Streptomyces sp. NPDC023588 TaxID=3154907 RepID=UPI0033CC00EE
MAAFRSRTYRRDHAGRVPQHVEKDAALERRFQPVVIDERSEEDAVSILRGLRERLEVFHGVQIQDGALVAVDLVDEACAMLRTEIDEAVRRKPRTRPAPRSRPNCAPTSPRSPSTASTTWSSSNR